MTPQPESDGPGVPRQVTSDGEQDPATELQTLTAEVERVPPLRPGEKAILIDKLLGSGELRAADRLLETHLGLVLDLALTRAGRGLTLGDLFQEGSVGLLAAIRAFSASGEGDFDAFIAGQVALALEDALAEEERAGRQEQLLLEAAAEYDRVELELAGELKRVPTIEEIGARLEWPPERAEHVRTVVIEARRVHDEELLQYLDPDLVDIGDLISEDDVARN